MTRTASGTLEVDSKFQYLHALVRREALSQFDLLSNDVESTETLNVDYIIRVLTQYFYPVDDLPKQKRTIRCGMKNLAV